MISNTYHRFIPIALISLFVGNAVAQTAEELYETGMYEYNQINYGAAVSHFREAADMGHAAAQAKLGTLLDAAEEDEEAREWFGKAAGQGNIEGQMGLARMLALGEGGEADQAGAVELYVAAADNGSLEAMRILYVTYRDGDMGVEIDTERADYWLQRAADEGDAWSREQLANRNASD